jgi:phosphoenolpyruvate-protein kinase (PTS system EI component)
LAIDRTDEQVAGQYEPAAPAVLRLLRGIAVAARRAGRSLSVCGEMAADPAFLVLLVGLGFRSFSITPAAIPLVKRALRDVDSRAAAHAARRALRAGSAEEVRTVLAAVERVAVKES